MKGRVKEESYKFVKSRGGGAPFMRCGKQKKLQGKRDRKKTERKESYLGKKRHGKGSEIKIPSFFKIGGKALKNDGVL